MFRQILEQKSAETIFNQLTPFREQCLYLYCNIDKYGCKDENFKIFIDEVSGSVIGMYYGDSVHIFAKHGIDDAAMEFIKANYPRTIFSSHPIDGLVDMEEETTGVYRLNQNVPLCDEVPDIQILNAQEIGQLTNFLYANSVEYQKTYDKKKLEEQLLERLESGYCRYFGKYHAGEMIGCAFTKAEISNVMVVGGILVSPEYRGAGIGKGLCLHKGRIAQLEHKTAYCFIDDANKVSINLHESVGYRKVSTVYKYTIHK